jgi:uncharacterized protein (TIGR02145 family)
MCHNLGAANTAADPFTPSWEIIGGYWQWGRKGPDPSQWLNTNTPNFAHGPTGPDAGETNEAAVGGWITTGASNGAWMDASKTADDPCPAGFRVPTKAQWDGVKNEVNNPRTYIGTWSASPTNYSNGIKFGPDLMLPAPGYRTSDSGQLDSRGSLGYYWSSLENGSGDAWYLLLTASNVATSYDVRPLGFSLRCIAEDSAPPAGSIGTLNCGSAAVTGTLTAGSAASGVSVRVPYTGGNGGTHSGQVVASTGVTGLTATLAAGSFANGADSLSCTISGTPSTYGIASFALNIGGQTCTISLPVSTGCRAKVNAMDYKDFLCHNLGAANTAAAPFTPSWEIIGGYWQWGRIGPDPSQWLNTNTPNFAHGPTGLGAGETNEAAVSGWDQTNAPNGSWLSDSKSSEDPCPSGFRVPSAAQWDAVRNNNVQTATGTWTSSPVNYGTGRFFGTELMLPGTGIRDLSNGSLGQRGESGRYWTSTQAAGNYAYYMFVSGTTSWDDYDERRYGFSLRCIAE